MKTIKDIAEEANVSTGTVDRVIHNRPRVSPKTKEKVEKLLKKYNFERNVLASTLAFKKKYTIATLIPYSESIREFWNEPNRGIKTASEEIKKYGFKVQCFYFDKFDLQSYSTAFDEILKLNPNGVLLAPFFYKTSINFAAKLDEKQIPYLFINIDIESLQNLSFIGQDNFKSGFLSGKLLNSILADNEHVLIIRATKNVDNHNAIELRIKGFFDFFRHKNIPKAIKQTYAESFDEQDITTVVLNELSKDKLIKGILVPCSSAFAVARFLEKQDLKGIHLVGFDSHINNLECLDREAIDFLIDQNPYEQGYKGLKILFEFLLFNKIPDKIYNSPIHIITKENADYFRKTIEEQPVVNDC